MYLGITMNHQKSDLKIDWCTHEAAKYACLNWHYSKCIPPSKLVKVGVWEDDKFIGCILYGVGATDKLVNPYGLKKEQGCELVRIALKTHKTPVSRIMAIAVKFLKQHCPHLKIIVSFADPSQGHHGGIYQANNWLYSGRSPSCKFPIIKGKVTHPKTLSHMVKAGKIKRFDVEYVLKEGKHRYLMPLNNEMRDTIKHLAKPYPKRVTKANSGDQLESGGAIPTNTLQSSDLSK